MENPLLELQEYDNLIQALNKGKGPLQVTGTLDSQKVHLMYELGEGTAFPWKLVVTYDDTRAKEIYENATVSLNESLTTFEYMMYDRTVASSYPSCSIFNRER